MSSNPVDEADRAETALRSNRREFVGGASLGLLALANRGTPVAGAHIPVEDAPAASEIAVMPRHGTITASPGTEITFRGISAVQMEPVSVVGSLSGAHSGVLHAHAGEQGVSFVPDAPFLPGERVTVRAGTRLRATASGSVTFTIATPVAPVTTPVAREIEQPLIPPQAFRTRPDLPPPAMNVTTRARGTAPGHVFLGAKIGDGYKGAMIVDNDGELIWFAPLDSVVATNSDVRVQEYRGQPVIAMWEGIARQGTGFGHLVLLDGAYETVATVQVGNGYPGLDQHECQLTARDTALVIVYNPIRWDLSEFGGKANGTVLDGIVQEIEIETGRVLFEWHSLDHIAPSESYGQAPADLDEAWDYFHLNSIEPTANGNFILSARHTHAVYKIERQSGRVLWRLNGRHSDFQMGAGSPFYFQHDARLHPHGELTLFDNVESDQGRGGEVESRGLVLWLDEMVKSATVVREYLHPTGILSVSQGNMQVLPNGNVFIGWGSAPVFSEFDANGTLIFNGRFPRGGTSYRAHRCPWVGSPAAPPDVAVETGLGDDLTVFASWNGATEVAGWEVLAGADPGQMEAIGAAPRTGFETSIEVQTTEPCVAVRALDASGAVLGVSEVIDPRG